MKPENTNKGSPTPIQGPSVWTARDFAEDQRWLYRLAPGDAQTLKSVALRLAAVAPEDLHEDEARAALAPLLPLAGAIKADLAGRGFVLLRGVPVRDMDTATAGRALWLLGMLLGQGMTQNAQGDLLCPVTDRGVDFGYTGTGTQRNVRGYQSRADLNYHCDPTDVVALLCVRKAMAGGFSTIVSTPAIYNEILRDRPDLLAVLERGFPYDRKGEEWANEAPVTDVIPVFTRHAGEQGDRVSCRYARSYIVGAAVKLGRPLDALQLEAMDMFDHVARREGMALQMAFEPGDVQLLNNYTVVHGRTAYEDDPDPDRRRFLYRLWLDLGNEAPWAQETQTVRRAFARFGNLGRTAREWADIRSRHMANTAE